MLNTYSMPDTNADCVSSTIYSKPQAHILTELVDRCCLYPFTTDEKFWNLERWNSPTM